MTALTFTPTTKQTAGAVNGRAGSPTGVVPRSQRTVGQVLRIGIPLTIVVVFVATVVSFMLGGIPAGEAVGYGAYLAFWIGGGFGLIASGAYYSHITDAA